MTKETFKGVCSVLSSLPSNVKWDEGIAAIYMTIMRNWDDRVVGEIMRHVLLKCEFRPTIAELRNIGLRIFADMPTVQQLQQVVQILQIFLRIVLLIQMEYLVLHKSLKSYQMAHKQGFLDNHLQKII
jgi:hypothetical protein